jgi:protocatechuate 3,4-dioxygenase, beta subunit
MTQGTRTLLPTAPFERMPTCPDHKVSRREVLRRSMAIGAVALASPTLAVADERYGFDPNGPMPTPDQFLGPFYPVQKPADGGADMARLAGREGQALGQVIYVTGRVLNLHGEPCPNVDMEIWQPNAAGRYTHSNDLNPAPLDPNFDGYSTLVTDAEGRYNFRTIKPGAYPVIDDYWRPPHIHYQLTGQYDRLVTQMYFPDEPLNAKDPVLQVAWANETLIAQIQPPTEDKEPDSKVAVWDVVLIRG